MKQQSLFDKSTKRRYARTEHGGSKAKGRRKLERPFAKRKWIHLVLKSDKARGKFSLKGFKAQPFVESLVFEKGKKFGVDIGDYVNVGDHLHLKVRASCKLQFQKFLKSISGRIARFVTGARRGKPFGRFWESLAYSRVLVSGMEEMRLHNYFCANRMEARFGYRRREEYRTSVNEWLRSDPWGNMARSFEDTDPARSRPG